MARSKLTNPCERNSVRVHEDAPTSNFRKRIIEARRSMVERTGSYVGRPELDIDDNPFQAMMQSNRGVL